MALSLKQRSHLLDVADHYLAAKKPKQAEKVLRGLSPADTTIDTKRYLLLLGESLIEQNHYGEGVEVYREAARKFPDDKDVQNHLIHGLFKSESSYLDGIPLAESMIVKYPNDFWYVYILANALRRFSNDCQKVEELLKHALNLAPTETPVQQLLFDVACEKLDVARCKDALDVLMKNEPESVDTIARLARYEMLNKRYKEASTLAQQALRQNPDEHDALYVARLADRYLSKSPFEKLYLATDDYITGPARSALGNRSGALARWILFTIEWAAVFLRILVFLPLLVIFVFLILCSIIVGIAEFPIFLAKGRTYVAGRIFDFAIKLR
jgi:predicted Zn-dependent protease